jgi:2-haloacid dehalogenase
MIDRPLVVVFDVNETLSDLRPLARRFADVGAPPHLLRVWFAGVLRDGFALTAAGAGERFAVLAADGLRGVLHGLPLDRDVDAAVEHVLAGFAALGVHPDVPDGVRALRAAGCRLVTLSNGSVDVAERLLVGAGVRAEFARLLSVEDAGVWKPARGAYRYAAQVCGVAAADTAGDRGSRVWWGSSVPVTSVSGMTSVSGITRAWSVTPVFGPIGVSRPRACQQMMARHRPGERAGPTTSVVRYSRASVGSTPCTGARSPGPGRRIVVVGTATTPTPRQSHRTSHQQPGSDRPNCAATGTSSPMAQPVTAPLDKAPRGDTFGMCKDRFGVNWVVNIAGSPA